MEVRETAWLETFGIANRLGTPDLALARDGILGRSHATAMQVAFRERHVDGFFSIDGVPTVAFVARDEFNDEQVSALHKALWNQGLASLLLVHLPTEVRVYSLWQRPLVNGVNPIQRDSRLVETLTLASDLMRARAQQLIPEVESGQYFQRHQDKFDRDTRIDAALLRNLRDTRKRLIQRGLPDDIASTLILQIIFIAYLEDRGIIDPEDFQTAIGLGYNNLLDVLSACDPGLLKHLFRYLQIVFNGDVFYAPGIFEASANDFTLESSHLAPIAEFRKGAWEMETGQGRFWPYDFQFIPVELISAIYDRFLNEDDKARKEAGAYFTPRFLADLVVDQVWASLDHETRADNFTVLDPACGSAIFLVRMFQKIVQEHKRAQGGMPPDWADLREYVERLYGWDIQEKAIRIGVFSLYVAMLEEVHPPTIRALKAEGKILPPLLGRNLCRRDFFEEQQPEPRFNIIVGNPPWVSRRSEQTQTALRWCKEHKKQPPNDEIAWAFIWKAAEHLLQNGRVAFLLPAMGILLNRTKNVSDARRAWLEGIEVLRIINFADLCFQLFDNAMRPTMFALYCLHPQPGRDYKIEYWVPKSHPLLSTTRLLIIPSIDRTTVSMSEARFDPGLWKKRMWATNRDMKLLAWLGDLPKLGRILSTYGEIRRKKDQGSKWVIGQGFKPFDEKSPSIHHDFVEDEAVTRCPYLDMSQFRPWVIPIITTGSWPTTKVHRAGFTDGFEGPHILIPQGVVRDEGSLRAAYVEQSLCFRSTIQAIRFPGGQERRAKVLTAIFNSSLAAWYYFHTSTVLGAERSKVTEKQLLDLPFPTPEEMPDSNAAYQAEDGLVRIMDEMLQRQNGRPRQSGELAEHIKEADKLVFDYYGLTPNERTLVKDTLRAVIPSMQPRKDSFTRLMMQATHDDKVDYAKTLLEALREWMRPGTEVIGRLIEGSMGAGVIELQLGSERVELQSGVQTTELEIALREIMKQLPLTMSRNLELHPDLKVFIHDALYVIKPLSARYWLASTALNDADDIAADLLSAEVQAKRKAGNEPYW